MRIAKIAGLAPDLLPLDHLTNRTTKHWSKALAYLSSDSYSNNRRNGWQYDADGNLTNDLTHQYTYDAAGQMTFVGVSNLGQSFDGDGQRVKTTQPNVTTYYVRSTVLGGKVIADLNGSGNKQMGYVYLGNQVLAEQSPDGFVGFVHRDPTGVSIRKTHSVSGNAYEFTELDPSGADTEMEDPYPVDPGYHGRGEGGPMYPGYGNITDPSRGCTSNGVFGPCDWGFDAPGGISTEFWGSRIADLPGFGTNWGSFAELGLWEHERRLAYTRARNGMVRPTAEGMSRDTHHLEYDPQNTGQRVPLSGDQAKAYKAATKAAKAGLNNADCQKFLRRARHRSKRGSGCA